MHDIASFALAVFLLFTSILHFAVPDRVAELVPEWLPAPRSMVLASGLVEAVLGAGLLATATRTVAAWVTAGLLAVYAGVHADDLRHSRTATKAFDRTPFVVLRVAANLSYAVWALYVAIAA